MQKKDGVRVSEISRDEVAHLAKLSRLALSEEELAQFATQIDEIVDSVSAVGNVDTEGVEPMSHPHSVDARCARTLLCAPLLQNRPWTKHRP